MGVSLEVGGKRRVKPHMNVTPLVDVVLVLLIIFMVIAPMMVKQFWLHVPKKDKVADATPSEPDPDDVPIVLSVRDGGSVWINKDPVTLAELPERLARIVAARGEQLLFFDAGATVPNGDAIEVLDTARGGGAINIAVLTDAVAR